MAMVMGRQAGQALEVSREPALVVVAQILVIRTEGIMVVILSSLVKVINSRITNLGIRVIPSILTVANIMFSLQPLTSVTGKSRSGQLTQLSRRSPNI